MKLSPGAIIVSFEYFKDKKLGTLSRSEKIKRTISL
jgi:hypothetical protein